MTRLRLVVLSLLLLPSAMLCQVPATSITPDTDTGIHVGGRTIPLGAVNPGTGNLTLSIPLASLPGRNGIGFNLMLQYDSKIWSPQVTTVPEIPTDAIIDWKYEQHEYPVGTLGWHLNIPSIVQPVAIWNPDANSYTTQGNWIVTLSDGTKHSIPAGNTGTGHWDAEDGSGIQIRAPYGEPITASLNDGTVIAFGEGAGSPGGYASAGSATLAGTITDRNGNVTTITFGRITDSSGHSIQLLSSSTELTGVQYTDTNGNLQTISFGYESVPFFSTASGTQYTTPANPFSSPVDNSSSCGRCLDGRIHVDPINAPTDTQMLQSITFPTSPSTQISFGYNGYGELISTNYPTGGYAHYEYGVFNHYVGGIERVFVTADFREVIAQYLCSSSTCTSSQETKTQWTPSIAGESNGGMTEIAGVGDPASRTTFLAFESYDHVPAVENFKQVSDASGTILQQVSTHNTLQGQSQFLLPDSITTWVCNGSSSETTTTTLVYDTAPLHVMVPAGLAIDLQTEELLPEALDQVVTKNVYDYATSPACSGSATAAQGPLLRSESTSFLSSDANYGTQSTAHLPSLPSGTAVYDASSNVMAQNRFEYDILSGSNHAALAAANGAGHYQTPVGGTYRGNLTALTKRVDASSNVTTYLQYNTLGQMAALIDPKGNTTTYAYDSSYYAPVQITRPSTNGVNHIDYYGYDADSGDLIWHNDQNSSSATDTTHRTSYSYDSLTRLQTVTEPMTPSGQPLTTIIYESPNLTRFLVQQSSGVVAEKDAVLDGLGRELDSQVLAPSAGCTGGVIHTIKTYDAMGRAQTVSNPYCSVSDPTYGVTTMAYDALGRTISVTHPDNTVAKTCYNGVSNLSGVTCSGAGSVARTWVDSWDESGKHWKHASDALGRVREVTEDAGGGSLLTEYGYDAVGNLRTVNQVGFPGTEVPRLRGFTYDSLSRLITSTNPETGTICYGTVTSGLPSPSNCNQDGYDANGNLLHKVDARGVGTSYSYDALNRLVQRSHTDGQTRTQWWAYDGKNEAGVPMGTPWEQNSIGRLSHTSDGISITSNFAYDSMGRLTLSANCLGGPVCNSISVQSATYDLAGHITSLTYPDGQVVTQTYDGAGRLAKVSSGGTDYISGDANGGIAYTPSGAEQSFRLGNGVTQAVTFNDRLQPCHTIASTPLLASITGGGNLLDRQSFYGATLSAPCGNEAGNNGNIWAIADNRNLGWSQGFGYDSLNRLTSANRSDGGYNHTYNYDSFGNMVPTDNLASGSLVSLKADANNRLLRSHDGGTTWGDNSYDAAGNLQGVSNGIGSPISYQYNASNQLLSVNSGQTASYLYDALDNRVSKQTASDSTDYVYFNGQIIAEKSQSGAWTDYVYANGRKIAKADASQPMLHVHGTRTSDNYVCGVEGQLIGGGGGGTVIATGDRLAFDFKQTQPTNGGLALIFDNRTVGAGDLVDMTNQTPTWFNNNVGSWQHLVASLDSYVGHSLDFAYAGIHQQTPPGTFDMWYANIVILHRDGSLTPIFTGQAGVTVANLSGNTCGGSNMSANTEPTNDSDPAVATRYYLDDHLGTTQMELSAGGWPTWQGQFTPFGQELPDGSTSMHYKFTGKERDTESGLDYFGARYYASSMGRWMSPDWADKPEAVPYASLDNPQSLNLYGYVGNNPLGRADPDGHCCTLDQIKTGLDVAGFIPVVGDVANAASGAISLAQGHYGEAALSFAAAVPFVGVLGEVGKGAELLKDAGILANRTKGLAGEVKVGEELVAEGTKVLGSHVGVQTEEGLRVVDKLVSKDGKLGAVEVKTGGATRTARQLAKDESMADKGGKIVGKNAPEALRGQTVKLPTEVRKPQP